MARSSCAAVLGNFGVIMIIILTLLSVKFCRIVSWFVSGNGNALSGIVARILASRYVTQ